MKIIDFMGYRRIAASISIALVLVCLASLVYQQLNFGLDFTGGTLVETHYSDTAPLQEIRATLADGGYQDAVVVAFGSDQDVLIRLPQGFSDTQGAELLQELQAAYSGEVELRRIEFVGPQVGDELKEQGGLAMLVSLEIGRAHV